MFERMRNGWELAKQSLRVLRAAKKLVVFPLLSGIACILVMISFALPLWFSGQIDTLVNEENPQANVLGYVVLFAFYLVNYFVIVFFNSAMVACAVIRFQGDEPTIGDGLNAALQRLPQIFGWALLAASVGVLLRVIESRSEKVGAIVASLLGMGWSIVTFFVVPVIVIEKAGPIKAVKRSTSILRKTWGESLSANVGIGAMTFLFNIPGFLLILAGVALLSSVNVVLGAVLIAAGILAMLVVALISSALNTIALATLYLFAATDRVPNGFDAARLTGAFKRK